MRTFLVGAGASAAAPARLPVFAVLRAYIIRRLDLAESAVEAASELAPERFMQSVSDGGLPLEAWLTETLSGGEPNAVHRILRKAIAGGDTVWTLNVDELIERAGKDPLVVSAFDDKAPESSARLLKPHGTVSRGHYIFRTDQVIRPLPSPWARRLQDDGDGHQVVVIGYAGADLDMRIALDDMLAVSADVTWFARESDRAQILGRFPSLRHGQCEFRGGADDGSLTPAFLSWADDHSLTSDLSPRLRDSAEQHAQLREPVHLPGDMRLAAALTLERVGDRKAARSGYLALMRTRPASRALQAARRVRTIDLYGGAAWTKPLLAVAASPAGPLLPRSMRGRLDRVHVTLLGSHQGDHKAAEQRARRVANPDDPAVILAPAKAARFTGRYSEAVSEAKRAEQAAAARDEIDILAHALYEQAFALTWSGQLGQARVVVNRLYSAVDGLAGIRWVAWAAWQMACLLVYANDHGTALQQLDRAETLFAADHLDAGIAAARTVRLTGLRMQGKDAEFLETERQLAAMRETTGWTTYTDCSVNIERAEFARAHDDSTTAREFYEEIIRESPDEPIHRCLALLGLAELARATRTDNTAMLRQVRDELVQRPMAYIDAHLSIAEHLAGEISFEAALTRIAAAAPELPTRTGAQASSPQDYCLGTHSQLHELYLP